MSIQRLKSVDLFAGLTDDQLKAIQDVLEPQKVVQDTVIIQEGAEGDSLFILLDGKAQVSRSLTLKVGARSFESRDKSFFVLDATGQTACAFGEMSVVDRSPRSATVTAITPCELMVMRKDDFERLCESDSKLGYRLLHNIAEKLCQNIRRANQDVLKLTTALSLALQK